MDPQGTAEAWYQAREATTPKLAAITAADLPNAIAGGQPRFDVVLIDTPVAMSRVLQRLSVMQICVLSHAGQLQRT